MMMMMMIYWQQKKHEKIIQCLWVVGSAGIAESFAVAIMNKKFMLAE